MMNEKKCNCLLNVFVLIIVLLLILCVPVYAEKDYSTNCSTEAGDILKAIENGSLDGSGIDTVTLTDYDLSAAEYDITAAIQNKVGALEDGKRRIASNRIIRIVVPKGEYTVSKYSIRLYSNVILDCRGDGADTPYNTADDHEEYNASDDSGGVEFYSSDHNGCIVRCGYDSVKEGNGENSHGYDFYKNMTVLGGTYYGKNANGMKVVGSNIRFGHAKNIRLIGLKVKDNCGAHHVEIGAVDKALIADSVFDGYSQGDISKKEYSIEAVQLDVTHRDNLNFTDYGRNDDLAAKNVSIINNDFSKVFRGVGSHHAVLGSYYENIKIKNNSFEDLDDRAINASYFKGGEISNNSIKDVVSGIFINSLVPEQYYQPNDRSKKKKTAETLNSNLTVNNNTIVLSGNKKMKDYFSENTIKYGIKAGGDNAVSAEISKTANEDLKNNTNIKTALPIPAGKYYLTGVSIKNNNISVDNTAVDDASRIKTGMLLWYLKGCGNITNNTIDLKNKNCNDNTTAGIKLNYSPNNTLTKNKILNVNYGSNALGIQVSNDSKAAKVNYNTINSCAKDGVSVTNISDIKNIQVNGNTVSNAKKCGITIFKSKIKSLSSNKVSKSVKNGIHVEKSSVPVITNNKVTNAGKQGINITSSPVTTLKNNTILNSVEKGIYIGSSTVKNITNNTVNNTKNGQGICINGTANVISGNRINVAKYHGILASRGKCAAVIQNNVITKVKGYAIFSKNGAKYILGNKLSGNKTNRVGISKGIAFKTKSVSVKKKKKINMNSYIIKSAGTIKWSSSQKKILKHLKKGKFKALKKGTVTVKALKNGLTTTCRVVVQ